MFAKLVALILALGACGGGLLAMRQSRLQAAHELAETRLRLREHDERLLRLKAEIAERTTPPAVGAMVASLVESGAIEPLVSSSDEPATLRMAPGPAMGEWDELNPVSLGGASR
ncbi:MAG: hypothetical protein DHS20C14_20690 [Phycisphaeraceae bacterium]|nr:MAG: hypothetical protein DHS20C14_20690 [Phycisphaeraceae bacterium]